MNVADELSRDIERANSQNITARNAVKTGLIFQGEAMDNPSPSKSFLKQIYAAIGGLIHGATAERALHKSSEAYLPKYHSGHRKKRTSRKKKQFHRQSKR